jgi:hypothetical protein
VADECRYYLMTRPIAPPTKKARDIYEDSPLKVFLDIDKEDLRTTTRRPRMEVIYEEE